MQNVTLSPEKQPVFIARHDAIDVEVYDDGWRYLLVDQPEYAAYLSADRCRILLQQGKGFSQYWSVLPLLRTAIECIRATQGVISLHAACIEKDGEAVCFTAPSGTGKSTRARQWVKTLHARMISGDRPSVYLKGGRPMVSGAPWDGKEQIFRNVQRPLRVICEIRRSDEVSAVRLSRDNARRLLMQQCFIPMWDDEAAVAAMTVIRRLVDSIPVIRLSCGMDRESARKAYELIYHTPERIPDETI